MSSKPTNKTTQWREEFEKRFKWARTPEGRGYLLDTLGEQSVDEVIMADFVEFAVTSTLELLEKEVEGMKKEQTVVINFVTVQGVFDDTGYNQALSHVLAIIRQHKEG